MKAIFELTIVVESICWDELKVYEKVMDLKIESSHYKYCLVIFFI